MSAPTSPKELIADLGGPHKVARHLGKSPGAARMWAQRNAIPRTAWPDLIEAFPHLTLEQLKRLEAA